MKAIQARWQAWWTSRHPRSDSHLMGQRNIYIVPSRPGLAFCATLLVLLLASINDQLSLGFMLTFLLTGAGLASMHSTHGNLRGLSLDLKPPAAVFKGEDVQLELRLHNTGAARFGIGVHVLGQPLSEVAWTDVPALGHALLQVRYPANQRGQHALPVLQIITRFPLGLFRAWSIWRPASQVWVYPQPEQPAPPFPAQTAEAGEDSNTRPALARSAQQGQDFEGVRAYRRGDSMRQVLWKKAALSLEQGGNLWVRETQAPVARTLWLDRRECAGIADEAQLSRLCAWVLAAEQLQVPYGLRLGAQEIAPELDGMHRQVCLELLSRAP
ncbi:DUF58 domain-containing protein [Paucibacter sp. Y2R2-4]|uniref:DUF58 domain-containing protein n=1 Tax=Paucibacter sp. Y2R2-4 TaxID=2893553 RepID=UPI0021E3BDDB|nr:DUF58 domain-containing protein [Paucibacter sp. Y2R2-4]MCV2348757.1 DUF58 domain-containing protein [Paucibacter sp. Y2R2-4]